MARARGADTVRRVSCVACGKAAILANTWAVRVLVIESKDPLREALRTILTGAGHQVIEAADAGVGLAAYESVPADVVFIDVNGSGRMEAGEFVRVLRREHPEARVVGMAGRTSSALADPLAVVRGLGAASTIRMPFAPAEVLRAIDEVRG
jgi:DNA-binding response OmpR family regulator